MLLIVNPAAGRAGAAGGRVELARRVLADHAEPAVIALTERPGHARDLARAALADGVRRIVAWGGDGTVNEVASVLASTPAALGIVPSGSGNGLARTLNLPRAPEDALSTALRGTPRAIDMGEMNGRLFVNIAGLGLDAEVAERFNDPRNVRRGLGGYVRIVARALLACKTIRCTIDAGGAERQARPLLVAFANGPQYGNGIRIAPDARVDDGRLDMVIVEERSRAATMRQLPRLVCGGIGRSPDWRLQTITEARITADTPMALHVDGEPLNRGSTAQVRVLPGVLKVVV
ncbi:MAG: diacylglycerol kinase family lipid kinase [Acidobacteria bacterium]|nr:diacylglycerol kinase family lipid kinase [Acidobacteriota bacterium]